MRALPFAVSLCVGGLVLGSCGRSEPGPGAGKAALEACRLPGGHVAQCVSVEVAEDPAVADGRTLTLSVSVLEATEPEGRAPVVLIAGGPGQGARAAYGPQIEAFAAIRRHHDLVLVDQRGTGDSRPLRCPDKDEALDLDEAFSLDVDAEHLAACLASFEGLDLTKYTTPFAIADLVTVLDTLGYTKANLMGGSYGTRVALAFARAYPQRVSTLVLDGVAPVDFALPLSFARDAQAALDHTLLDCEAQPDCASAFPKLREQAAELLASGDSTITVKHPRTALQVDVEVNGDVWGHGIRGMLYAPDLAALLPLAITEAAAERWDPLVAQSVLLSANLSDSMADGMFLSVVCAEDVPFITDEQVAAETWNTFLGTATVDNLRESCRAWPRAPIDPAYREPVHSDAPTLVLSGALDPVTPPRWGAHVIETLSNARHVIVPGAGHGTTTLPCADKILAEFFETRDPSKLQVGCLEAHERPPFFVDVTGPAVNPQPGNPQPGNPQPGNPQQ